MGPSSGTSKSSSSEHKSSLSAAGGEVGEVGGSAAGRPAGGGAALSDSGSVSNPCGSVDGSDVGPFSAKDLSHTDAM